MKQKKILKIKAPHRVRRYGVIEVKGLDSRMPVFGKGKGAFYVTYFYGVGTGPDKHFTTLIPAVDEVGAYQAIKSKLRNKELTNVRANRREKERQLRQKQKEARWSGRGRMYHILNYLERERLTRERHNNVHTEI